MAPSTYFGHDREEVTRILIQSLYDLGYDGAATALSRESGFELESPAVAAFRSAVLDGQWAEAEHILLESFRPDEEGDTEDGPSLTWGKLALAENADKNEMLFCLRQQKFLELLEARDLGAALMVLRQELTPLNHNTAQLHALSRYISCPQCRDILTDGVALVYSCVPPNTSRNNQAGTDLLGHPENAYYRSSRVSVGRLCICFRNC